MARTVRAAIQAPSARRPDPIALAGFGCVDRLLSTAATVLAQAAAAVDRGELNHADGLIAADRVRGTVR
ncbi:MAG: hypothetical protein Q4G34_01245 [Micrococcus sp.]|nr:hypothetical protein [Micrococcus sp.]